MAELQRACWQRGRPRRAGRVARLCHLLAGARGRRAAGRGIPGGASRISRASRSPPPTIGAEPDWFTPDGELRTLPFHVAQSPPELAGMDGFYAARLRRAVLSAAESCLSHSIRHARARRLSRLQRQAKRSRHGEPSPPGLEQRRANGWRVRPPASRSVSALMSVRAGGPRGARPPAPLAAAALALRPAAADELLIAPPDLRVAGRRAWSMRSRPGRFGLAGCVAMLAGRSPFAIEPPSAALGARAARLRLAAPSRRRRDAGRRDARAQLVARMDPAQPPARRPPPGGPTSSPPRHLLAVARRAAAGWRATSGPMRP